MRKSTKLPRRTVHSDLDQIIDWYERFKPEAGQVIDVTATAADLAKFATREDPERDDRWRYKGRTLRRVAP